MDTPKKSPNRLSIEMDEALHKKIKMHAVKRNITIRKWVHRAIVLALANEEKYSN